MTTGVVEFVTADFLARYPEFTALNTASPALLGLYFGEATLYLNNTTASRVVDIETRTPLLYMLTAHIAAMNGGVNGQQPSQLVGRIDKATEGTVSVSADMPGATANAAWFLQTKYGAAYWQATARYRQMRVLTGMSQNPPNVRPPWGGARGGNWGGDA